MASKSIMGYRKKNKISNASSVEKDDDVKNKFIYLYKYSSLVQFNSGGKKGYKDFNIDEVHEAHGIRENLYSFIDTFNALDLSLLNENIDIVKFHWKSIRNYFPLLLKFPSCLVEETDEDLIFAFRHIILSSMYNHDEDNREKFIGCDDRIKYFNSIGEMLTPVYSFFNKKIDIIPEDNLDIQILRIFKIYSISLQELISKCDQKSLEEIHNEILTHF